MTSRILDEPRRQPVDLKGSLLVARVHGIPIRIHITFLLVVPFLAYAFASAFVDAARLAGTPAGRIAGPPLLWGLAVALALFASVLVHELAHALYAIRHGGQVRSITLHMVGGVTELTAAPRSEALMALCGPVTSLVLGGVFMGLVLLAPAASQPSLRFALFHLGELNLALGVFNLLPAFPMDGGRVLRGVLTPRLGLVRATRIAARLGRGFAILFAALGFLSLNVLLLVVSFVVHVGAEAEARAVLLREALGGARVRDFMSPLESAVRADDTLTEVSDRMIRERRTAYPVTDGERVIGFVSVDGLKKVPTAVRGRTAAREALRPATLVDAGETLADAFHLFAEAGFPELAVMDEGRIVGTLSQLDVVRGLELRALARPEAEGGADRAAR